MKKIKLFNIEKEKIVEDILNVYNKNNPEFCKEYYSEYGLYSISPIVRLFGSWTKMLKELNLPMLRSRYGVTKEEVLLDVKNCYEHIGNINAEIYRKNGKFSQRLTDRLFGNFTKLLIEAGLSPNLSSYAYSDEELLEICRDIYEKYGVLSKKQIVLETNIPNATIINRLGSLQELYTKLNIQYFPVSEKFRIILDVLVDMFKEQPVLEWKHELLINPKTGINLRVDAYFQENNIAIEFDGEQHFKYKPHYHKEYSFFLYRKYLDNIKYKIMEVF